MSKIKIVEITSGQVSEIANLVNLAYRGDASRAGWTTEADLLGGQRTDEPSLIELIDPPLSVLLGLSSDKAFCGCVHLKLLENNLGYLGMLTVNPSSQGAGLGNHLLNEAESWLQNMGAKKVKMTVIAQRKELLQWYEKRGYLKTGKTEPFPYGNERFGVPKRTDLYFEVLEKTLLKNS
jgi:ribosomal protein S18 acetylase RimI-like enzyme